jgi:hypothetical protein
MGVPEPTQISREIGTLGKEVSDSDGDATPIDQQSFEEISPREERAFVS